MHCVTMDQAVIALLEPLAGKLFPRSVLWELLGDARYILSENQRLFNSRHRQPEQNSR